jgi:8-amino-7-oxononanoate synthase
MLRETGQKRYTPEDNNESLAVQSLDQFASDKLAQLERVSLRRVLAESARDGLYVERGGRKLLSFSCNDYLNLSHHPAVKAAAKAAIEVYGTGAGASRLVTGNHPLLVALEEKLARLKGTEAACVFGSGYLANLGVIATLVGKEDLILIDRLSHACIHAGAQLSGASTLVFDHNDMNHVASLLKANRGAYPHALLITEGVFSMDGDRAPLKALATLCRNQNCWFMIDDAHGLGVVGDGRGSAAAAGCAADIPLQMGTLSKAAGSYGGYLCASKPVIDLVKTRARTFIYSTGLPPASAGAAIAALDIFEQEPELTRLPLSKAQSFTQRLGLPLAQSPIVPLIIGEPEAALEASQLLAEEGFLVTAIRPPTVPQGTARLRIAFSAAHPDAEIERLADVIGTRLGLSSLCPASS